MKKKTKSIFLAGMVFIGTFFLSIFFTTNPPEARADTPHTNPPPPPPPPPPGPPPPGGGPPPK